MFSEKIMLFIYIEYNITYSLLKNKISAILNVLNINLMVVIYFLQDKFYNLVFSNEKKYVFIICNTPNETRILEWIKKKILKKKLNIDLNLIKILCKLYFHNLLGLSNTLELLSTTFKKKKITLKNVLNITVDNPKMSSFSWINSILKNDVKEGIRFLNTLQSRDNTILLLLKLLQKEILKAILIKKNFLHVQNNSKNFYFFQRNKVFFKNFLKRNSLNKLYKIMKYLVHIEKLFKDFNTEMIIEKLKKVTMILCIQ